MTETVYRCDHCQQEFLIDHRTEFDGKVLCPDCLALLTSFCSHCDTRFWRNELHTRHDVALCSHCLDNYHSYCCECGRLVPNEELHYLNDDDNEGYCDSCCHAHGPGQTVQNYYYKPEPIFYGEGKRFMGVELEIDEGGESNPKAAQIMNIANMNGLEQLYVKHDGSLNDGMELVSHPMTLDYHRNEMPWPSILHAAAQLGYYSHQTRTCGLHVHVNRTAFGETRVEQEDVIARILFFVENHWNELLRFSRRTAVQMAQWADRYGRKDDPKAVLDNAKEDQFERYKCVNLTNCDTIEFRMFRGTLKLNTFYATLQMVDRICDVALFLPDKEIQDLTWTDFAAGCAAPELVQYLKERRLYVNEPVQGTEEV